MDGKRGQGDKLGLVVGELKLTDRCKRYLSGGGEDRVSKVVTGGWERDGVRDTEWKMGKDAFGVEAHMRMRAFLEDERRMRWRIRGGGKKAKK